MISAHLSDRWAESLLTSISTAARYRCRLWTPPSSWSVAKPRVGDLTYLFWYMNSYDII